MRCRLELTALPTLALQGDLRGVRCFAIKSWCISAHIISAGSASCMLQCKSRKSSLVSSLFFWPAVAEATNQRNGDHKHSNSTTNHIDCTLGIHAPGMSMNFKITNPFTLINIKHPQKPGYRTGFNGIYTYLGNIFLGEWDKLPC